MSIYTLSHGDFEESSDFYFQAPEGVTFEQFESLVQSLVEPAADDLIRRGGYRPEVAESITDPDDRTWIGYRDLVTTIAEVLLPQHGYQRLHFKSVTLVGGIVGGCWNAVPYEQAFPEDPEGWYHESKLSREVYEKITAHNQKVKESLFVSADPTAESTN